MEEEEKNRQAEARRILDAIRKKAEEEEAEEEETLPQQPLHWLVEEDAAQLQALVDQSRGIKHEEENKEDPLPDLESIDPISVEQIKVMRQANAITKVKKMATNRAIYEAIIRAYCEVADFFKTSGKVKRCEIDGHQCLHCGKKFQVTHTMSDAAETPQNKQN